MFRVTLHHLDPNATSASLQLGDRTLGQLNAEAVIGLLSAFVEVDPVQNNDAEPEILIETRGGRHLIRTAGRKLFLQNARRLNEPALALTPGEIVAELDGSAPAARRASVEAFVASLPPFPVEAPAAPDAAARPREKSSRVLMAVAGVLLAAVGWQHRPARDTPFEAPEWVNDARALAAERTALAGVYLTGPAPGQFGLALTEDGGLTIFLINAQAAPSVVHDTYRVGHVAGKLVLGTSQPGGLIRAADRNTLAYCGEVFRRVP